MYQREAEAKEIADKYFGDYTQVGEEIKVRFCPFCKGGEHRDKYTFYLNMEKGVYNCHRGSCGKSGTFNQLCDYLGEPNVRPTYATSTIGVKEKKYNKPDAAKLRPVTQKIIDYFACRKISKETLDHFQIMSDENGNIVFPFYRQKELVFVKYRKPEKYIKGSGMSKEWCDANTESILFGMDHASFNQPLFITEGQMDAMSLYEAGINNVVSVPMGAGNTEWIDHCWGWLNKFKTFVLFGDSDEPGVTMINEVSKRLGEDKCMLPPAYPNLFVGGIDKGIPCKDANEILYCYGPDILYDVAKSCKAQPIVGFMDLSKVKRKNRSQIARIYTRIPNLDRLIGGIAEGSLTIVTGKTGCGKSTFTEGLALNAIEQGYKVALYSGELDADTVKDHILLQACDKQYVTVEEDFRTKKAFPVVTPQVENRIDEWMAEKVFIFDNKMRQLKQSVFDMLVAGFEGFARQYGCKLFIVDNLMMLQNSTSGQNVNEVQQYIVDTLKSFAQKYNVMVILVCHPRKRGSQDRDMDTDDVRGSGTIIDLCDTLINVQRGNIQVKKAREFGELGDIEVAYSKCNRRIYQANIGDKMLYHWDHEGVKIPEIQAMNLSEFQDEDVYVAPF